MPSPGVASMPRAGAGCGVASMPHSGVASMPRPGPPPPQQVSEKMRGMLKETTGQSDQKQAAVPELPGVTFRGGAQLTTPPTQRMNPFHHIFHMILITYIGLPAVFYYFTPGNENNPWQASWCEKVLRDLLHADDPRLARFGLTKMYNLWVNNQPQHNTNGYFIRTFMAMFDNPVTLEQAKQLGDLILEVVNHETNNRPKAVCPLRHSVHHPENPRFQDAIGNEAVIDVCTFLHGNPINEENYYDNHEEEMEAMVADDSLCATTGAILKAPPKKIHSTHRTGEQNRMVAIERGELLQEESEEESEPEEHEPAVEHLDDHMDVEEPEPEQEEFIDGNVEEIGREDDGLYEEEENEEEDDDEDDDDIAPREFVVNDANLDDTEEDEFGGGETPEEDTEDSD